jgi:hypothetical protein
VFDITVASDGETAAAGAANVDPPNAVGSVNGKAQALMFAAAETFDDFQTIPVANLANLLNPDTVLYGDVPTPADLGRTDLIAFERNGPNLGEPGNELGWESCTWTLSDGVSTVSVEWNGLVGATRDAHLVANGRISGSTYADHFTVVPANPADAIGFDEVISYLVFALPELATDGPHSAVRVQHLDSSAVGSNTPGIDAIGVLPR